MHMSHYLWLCVCMMHFSSCGNVSLHFFSLGESKYEMIPEPFCLFACTVCIRTTIRVQKEKNANIKINKQQTQWMGGDDGANEKEQKNKKKKKKKHK